MKPVILESSLPSSLSGLLAFPVSSLSLSLSLCHAISSSQVWFYVFFISGSFGYSSMFDLIGIQSIYSIVSISSWTDCIWPVLNWMNLLIFEFTFIVLMNSACILYSYSSSCVMPLHKLTSKQLVHLVFGETVGHLIVECSQINCIVCNLHHSNAF